MKTIFNSIFILLLYFQNTGCQKPCLSSDDKNSGIIVSEFEIGSSCFTLGRSSSYPMVEEFVIDNDSAYKSWIDTVNIFYNPQCSSAVTPSIDFTKYTLLGKYAEGGCEVKFVREVIQDDLQKSFIYTIGVDECGICKKLQFSWNWVLVPKLPQGYSVKFIVKKI